MAESYLRQDALAHRGLLGRPASTATQAGVRLWMEGPTTQLALRGDAGDAALARAVRKVTGAALPAPLRASHGESADVLWMGPDEWLVVGAEDPTLHSRMESAMARRHALVSDVSSSRVTLGLGGEHAVSTLAKGCSLDLHARAFPEDQVAQSALARAHAMLHRLEREQGFHIYVHRSFADYLFRWLEDASAEYGLAIG